MDGAAAAASRLWRVNFNWHSILNACAVIGWRIGDASLIGGWDLKTRDGSRCVSTTSSTTSEPLYRDWKGSIDNRSMHTLHFSLLLSIFFCCVYAAVRRCRVRLGSHYACVCFLVGRKVKVVVSSTIRRVQMCAFVASKSEHHRSERCAGSSCFSVGFRIPVEKGVRMCRFFVEAPSHSTSHIEVGEETSGTRCCLKLSMWTMRSSNLRYRAHDVLRTYKNQDGFRHRFRGRLSIQNSRRIIETCVRESSSKLGYGAAISVTCGG